MNPDIIIYLVNKKHKIDFHFPQNRKWEQGHITRPLTEQMDEY